MLATARRAQILWSNGERISMQLHILLIRIFTLFSVGGAALALSALNRYVEPAGTGAFAQTHIDDCRLYGKWIGCDGSSDYRLNVTPHVVFIASEDGQDVFDVAVNQGDLSDQGGSLVGEVKSGKLECRRSPFVGERASFSYKIDGDSLELTCDHFEAVLSLAPQRRLKLRRASHTIVNAASRDRASQPAAERAGITHETASSGRLPKF